jgi:hypothetical protein
MGRKSFLGFPLGFQLFKINLRRDAARTGHHGQIINPMKVRIQGNSIRIRLSEAEVQQFVQSGRVDEAIAFGMGEDQALHFVLAQRDLVSAISVDFTGNSVMVYVPESVAAAWAENADTGLSGVVDNGTAPGLKILVEQDQDCQH